MTMSSGDHGVPRRTGDAMGSTIGPGNPPGLGEREADRARKGSVVRAVLPVLSGLGFIALALSELVLPDQRQPFAGFGDYLIEACFVTGLWAGAGAALVLDRVHRPVPGWGWFGRIAVGMYAVGQVLLGITTGATLINGRTALDLLFLPGTALWLLGGVLVAAALVRARLLPWPLAVALAAGVPLAMAIGPTGPVIIGAVWLAVAVVIARLPVERA
ncbi:hypothetical protein AB0K60_15910 [Thermopolyspora sp. NPDC052614]|uniref:hypothetical protein n=1 Tax=Thermopolyspora sp. NPDC052614 TaxID=3155682 RepID=UPI00343B5A65